MGQLLTLIKQVKQESWKLKTLSIKYKLSIAGQSFSGLIISSLDIGQPTLTNFRTDIVETRLVLFKGEVSCFLVESFISYESWKCIIEHFLHSCSRYRNQIQSGSSLG